MNIQPLNDRVIIKPITKEDVTKSGIILPDTADKEKPEQGEVVAVGPGKLLENGNRATMSVQVGNKVLFESYALDKIKVGDEELFFLTEDKILGVIN